MPASALGRFVHRLTHEGDPDAVLVRRFVDTRSEAAFAEIVRRYGPVVFGVCRRVLGDHHLAEDALQAVFVVLARKADTIRPPGAVGGWLYGVARKAAAEAAAMRRRKAREVLPGTLPDMPAEAAEIDDTAEVVDAEIASLPPALRAAVVLCEIEGVGRAEAARRLGVAEGTLSSRLAAARKRLRERLQARGAAPALAVVLPAALARAADRRADGRAEGCVLELSHGVMRAMFIAKLKAPLLWGAAVVAALFVADPRPVSGTDPRPSTAPRRVQAAEKPPEWKAVFTLKHTHPVQAVAAAKDLIAAAADVGPGIRPKVGDYVRFWSADGKPSDLEITPIGFSTPVRFHFLRFTKDDEALIVGTEHTGTRYRRRPGGLAADTLSGYDLLACSPDLNTLLVRHDINGSKPNHLNVHVNPWEVDDNFIKPSAVFDEACKTVTHADVSADDRRVAVVGDDGDIRLYDRASLRRLRTITLPKTTVVTAVRFSPDGGRLAVVGEAGFARLYADGEGVELKGHTGTVTAVAFAPDGKRLVTASGKVVREFDADTGKAAGSIAAHEEEVTAVAFSTDGKRLVTGSADKTAKVWERK